MSIEVHSAPQLLVSSLRMLIPFNIIISITTFIPPSSLFHLIGEMWGTLDEGWMAGSSSRTLVHAGVRAASFLTSCSSRLLPFFSPPLCMIGSRVLHKCGHPLNCQALLTPNRPRLSSTRTHTDTLRQLIQLMEPAPHPPSLGFVLAYISPKRGGK